jgi:hypothetical protein
MVLNSAKDSLTTPRIPGPMRPVMIATCNCGMPTLSAATNDPNSQGSRTTRSGRQSIMISLSVGSAACASRRAKTSASTSRFISSNVS